MNQSFVQIMILRRKINVNAIQVAHGHDVIGDLRAQLKHVLSEVIIMILKIKAIKYSFFLLQKDIMKPIII